MHHDRSSTHRDPLSRRDSNLSNEGGREHRDPNRLAVLLMTAATETIANRASTPGSGEFCGRTMESEPSAVVSGLVATTRVGLTWTGGKVELALSGVGATRRPVAAVLVGEALLDPPTAALSWLLVEPGRTEPPTTPCVV